LIGKFNMNFLFVIIGIVVFSNMQSSQVVANQKNNEIWRNAFISGKFEKRMPWPYGELSDEQKNNSFVVNENEYVLLFKEGQCAVMAPLEPCQAIVIEGTVKMAGETEYKNRTLCVHKQISCFHQSISNLIQFFFPHPQKTIRKIMVYSNKMNKEAYEDEECKKWGLGLKQTDELRYFIDYLANALSISPDIIKAYLWKNNVIPAHDITAFPAKGLIVIHSAAYAPIYKSLFPPLENYLGNFSSINLKNTGNAWDKIRELLPDNSGIVYNTKKLTQASSYLQVRKQYGNKIDDIIQYYIDLETQKPSISKQQIK
jgi:hypothetical protein